MSRAGSWTSRSSRTRPSSGAWCSSAAYTAWTKTRSPSNWPRCRSGCTASPSALRSRSSTTTCAAEIRLLAYGSQRPESISASGADCLPATPSPRQNPPRTSCRASKRCPMRTWQRYRSRPPCSAIEETTSDLRGLLDFVCGLRWQTAGMKSKQRKAFEAPLVETLGVDPDKIRSSLLARGPDGVPADSPGAVHSSRPAFRAMWNESRIADRERCSTGKLHSPACGSGWQDDRPKGGFDAVIGNPPWDRIKLQEVEWFATRAPDRRLP